MLRVTAIPGEPTRFNVSSRTLVCDNPKCSEALTRWSRHQVVRGQRSPTEYLAPGDDCPKCLARHEAWKDRCRRVMRSDETLAQKEELAVKLSKGEPEVGKLQERFHLVDIAANSGAGKCSCEFFECAMQPLLDKESSVEQAAGKHRCQHVIAARSWALDLALRCHEVERYKHARGQREERAA